MSFGGDSHAKACGATSGALKTKRLPAKSRQVVPATESRLKCFASGGCGWSESSPAPRAERGPRSEPMCKSAVAGIRTAEGETCWKPTALKAVGFDLAMETKLCARSRRNPAR